MRGIRVQFHTADYLMETKDAIAVKRAVSTTPSFDHDRCRARGLGNSLIRPQSPSSVRSRQLPRLAAIAVERAVLTTPSFGHDRRQARGLDNSLVRPRSPSSVRTRQLPRSAVIAVKRAVLTTPSFGRNRCRPGYALVAFERFGVLSASATAATAPPCTAPLFGRDCCRAGYALLLLLLPQPGPHLYRARFARL
jgi:hypothetical protein